MRYPPLFVMPPLCRPFYVAAVAANLLQCAVGCAIFDVLYTPMPEGSPWRALLLLSMANGVMWMVGAGSVACGACAACLVSRAWPGPSVAADSGGGCCAPAHCAMRTTALSPTYPSCCCRCSRHVPCPQVCYAKFSPLPIRCRPRCMTASPCACHRRQAEQGAFDLSGPARQWQCCTCCTAAVPAVHMFSCSPTPPGGAGVAASRGGAREPASPSRRRGGCP